MDWGRNFREAIRSGGGRRQSVVESEERDEMMRQMAIRRYARLTKATVTEIGVNLDANQVVWGDFQFTAAAAQEANPGKELRGEIRIQAQIMNIREVRRGPAFAVSGPIEQLSRLETELAWKVTQALMPQGSLTEQQFLTRHPAIRLDAMESYIRGLLSTMPDQKLRLFAQAVRLEPGYSQPVFNWAGCCFPGGSTSRLRSGCKRWWLPMRTTGRLNSC